MKVDYLIIGQGIAGTVFLHHLHLLGKTFVVISQDSPQISSRVATGLYNPITGRNMILTWKAHDIFQYLIPFYQQLETFLGTPIIYQKPIYRPFISIKEQNEWMGKSTHMEYIPFISAIKTESIHPHIVNPYGGLMLNKSGFIDLNALLDSYKSFLRSKNLLIEVSFNEEKLQVGLSRIKYQDIYAEKLIFCTGVVAKNNRFFDWLPFNPVKGELIEIKSNTDVNFIPNKGVFMLRKGKNVFKVGSTYSHDWQCSGTTEKGVKELTRKLDSLFTDKYEITNQTWGVRPATKDRKPFIGLHPKHNNIGVFGGLGTKGVSLTPYYARQFVNFLEKGQGLDPEVNINRYNSLLKS